MRGVLYVEIPVDDLERAIGFYQHVFEVELERMQIDGNDMAMFPRGEGGGVALAKGDSYRPSMDGARVYFDVDDIDAQLERVVFAGGTVEYPKTMAGEFGHVAEFRDSEGNRIGLTSE